MDDFAPGPYVVQPGTFSVYTHFDHRRVLKVADARQKLFTPECQAANARLFAAAPDLVETLETVDAYLAPNGDDDDIWHEIRAIIQAAIAQAKGG